MSNHFVPTKASPSQQTDEQKTCGEALVQLLEQYDVDTVFGIPGVHTLDFCRGLNASNIQHVQARNEQGAGFMADGYARTSGKPGVALVISGPGVTNASTAIGQSFADSIPVLLLSSDTASHTHGKGWGCLHEVTDLNAMMAPLTAFSAKAIYPDDLPELLGQAFSIFTSARPRPVHISVPIDVLAQLTSTNWKRIQTANKPQADHTAIKQAVHLLKNANNPVFMLGGGAVNAATQLTRLTDQLNATVVCSTAGKGIVADTHPLSLGASTVRPEVQAFLKSADVILAVGTEIGETDSFVEKLDITDKLIRLDIDARKMNDLYPAGIALISDAKSGCQAIVDELGQFESSVNRQQAEQTVLALKQQIMSNLTASEQQHNRFLQVLRENTSDETIFLGDICQLVYSGAFAMDVNHPRQWHYPAGFCTLGCGLPNAIGAKLAQPEKDMVVLAGDGGVMFTIQELVTAAELKLALPVVIWENGGLKQIQDDMIARDIPLVGVEGINPDFIQLAKACHCHAERVASASEFSKTLATALKADRPTVICVSENDPWLL